MSYKPSNLDISFISSRGRKPQGLDYSLLFAHAQKTARRNAKNPGKIIVFAFISVFSVSVVLSLAYLSGAGVTSKKILGDATVAYQELQTAKQNLQSQDFKQALSSFSLAEENLHSAQSKLDSLRPLSLLASQARTADKILQSASEIVEAGRNLTSAFQIFDGIIVNDEKLKQNYRLLSVSLGLLKDAQSNLAQIASVPEDFEFKLSDAKKSVSDLTELLEKIVDLQDLYLSMFIGRDTIYLVVFQNYDEARATGGFVGTYGVLRLKQGKIEEFNIKSIYDLDGRINKKIAAPGPFQPEIKTWGARDANWFVDFFKSSEKLLYFLEQGQETADGVIAFTPAFFEQLLTITGPVYVGGQTLSAVNFQDVVQYQTSVVYDKQLNQPKKFLDNFASVMLGKLASFSKEQWFAVFEDAHNNLSGRQILFYSKDAGVQAKIEKLRFGGRVLETDLDYLMIVNSNLGGTKNDLKIEQNVNLATKILSDGSVINYLDIIRTNTSQEKNRNYLRVLVPKGSELITLSGVDAGPHDKSAVLGLEQDPDLAEWDHGELVDGRVFVRTEAGKTEFASWVNTTPGQTKTVKLVYKLPFKVKTSFFKNQTSYSILFQRQSGSKPYQFKHQLISENLVSVWNTESLGQDVNSNIYWAAILKHD